MRVKTNQSILLALLLCSAMLAGCTADDESSDDSAIDLVIYYDSTSWNDSRKYPEWCTGIILRRRVIFDYAYTKSTSRDIDSFYFEAGDGSSRDYCRCQ